MHGYGQLYSDLLKAREIMGEDRPWELRRLGRKVRGLNVGEWRRRAPTVVYKGNRAKFLQNEGAKRENVLIEASRGDRFWGIGFSCSCHQISVFHLSTHFFAVSLNLLRSSNKQGCARRVHCISCVQCSLLPDRTLCSLLHVNPVRSRFRHLHVVHGLSNPLAKLSSMLTVALCGIACSFLSHALHQITLGGKSAGFTLRQKQFFNFSLFSATF